MRYLLIILTLAAIASCNERSQTLVTAPPQIAAMIPATQAEPASQPAPKIVTTFEIDALKKCVQRLDAGKIAWTFQLAEYSNSHRAPDLVYNDKVVIFSNHPNLVALDANTGRQLWRIETKGDRLHLSGDLILATDCSAWSEKRLLIARIAQTGKEIFQVDLPTKDFDPDPIIEVGDHFIVQSQGWGDRGTSILFDRSGKTRERFKEQIVTGKPAADGLVLLTYSGVTFVPTKKDARAWTIPFRREEWIAGGELIALPNGDLLASQFGRIKDSGVTVMRIDPKKGAKRWEIYAKRLGVGHSKYFHDAAITLTNDTTYMIKSVGSYGTFYEFHDLNTGDLKSRIAPPEDEPESPPT